MRTSSFSSLCQRLAVLVGLCAVLFVAASLDTIFPPTADTPAGNHGIVAVSHAETLPPEAPPIRAVVQARTEHRGTSTKSAWEAELAQVPEVSLQGPDDRRRLFRDVSTAGGDQPVLAYFDSRADLRGLPVRRGDDCQGLPVLSRTSKQLRTTIGSTVQFMDVRKGSALRSGDLPASARREIALAAEAQPLLLWQMCQCERDELRHLMLEVLQMLDGAGATQALARMALFDADAEIRQAAATSLRSRAPVDYRAILLSGFRHPWSAVADNAATALTLVADRGSVPALKDLLNCADPTCPGRDDSDTPLVYEMVRINHARNCQLCHAPSYDSGQTARAAVPSLDVPLPPTFSPDYGTPCADIFVRADITYLRPDFSMTLPVKAHGPWPERQRYDFIVRTRPATPEEQAAPKYAESAQRKAVVRALKQLTGDGMTVSTRFVQTIDTPRGE